MEKLAKALGERIRVQRKACRISQDALALADKCMYTAKEAVRQEALRDALGDENTGE